jgi:hypothetical protein
MRITLSSTSKEKTQKIDDFIINKQTELNILSTHHKFFLNLLPNIMTEVLITGK